MRRVLLSIALGCLFVTCILVHKTTAETRVDGARVDAVGTALLDSATNQSLVDAQAYTDLGTNGLASESFVATATNNNLQDAQTAIDSATNGLASESFVSTATNNNLQDAQATLDLTTNNFDASGITVGTLADGLFDKTGDWTGTFDGLEGATLGTNFTIVASNTVNVIRVGNNYIIHVPSNNAAAASIQDIRAKVNMNGVNFAMADNTDEPIPFSNEVYDVGSGWNTTTHQYDAPVNGDYSAYVQPLFQGTLTDGSFYIVRIKTNNNITVSQYSGQSPGTGSMSVNSYIELTLTTNHFIEFTVQHNGTTDNLNGDGSLTFAVIRLIRED